MRVCSDCALGIRWDAEGPRAMFLSAETGRYSPEVPPILAILPWSVGRVPVD